MLFSISILIAAGPPPSPDQPALKSVPRRVFDAYDDFAAALGEHHGAPVEILEEPFPAELPDGMLLFDGHVGKFLQAFGTREPGLAGRVVQLRPLTLIDELLAGLEEHKLAGAIARNRYFEWKRRREDDQVGGRGVYGRKDIAEKAGLAGPITTPFQSHHYVQLISQVHNTLPSLVFAYLVACWEHERMAEPRGE